MDVLALSGSTLDRLPVLGAVAVLLVLGMLLLVRMPRLAIVGWLVVLCFIPVWAGTSVGVDVEPHVLAGVGLVACLIPFVVRGRLPFRLTWGDGVFLAFVVASLLPIVSGRLTVSAVFVLLAQWTSAYIGGRLIGYRVPLGWVFGATAVAFTAVAALALVESVTGWNPFVHVPGSGNLWEAWSSIQDRGDRARAEGAFGHSIALGASLAMAVPITLAAPFRTSVRVLMVLTMLGASVVTFSRIGLLTAVIGIVLSSVFLRTGLSARLRLAVTAALVVAGVVFGSLITSVFAAAGAEASQSAEYRLTLLGLIPGLETFGYASTAYWLPTGQLILADVPSADGTLHSIDNALLLLGLTYGWVPMALVIVALLAAAGRVLARRVTAPTIALVAQIPAFATVALITQYSSLTWFIAGLAVFSESMRRNGAAEMTGHSEGPPAGRTEESPQMVDPSLKRALPTLS